MNYPGIALFPDLLEESQRELERERERQRRIRRRAPRSVSSGAPASPP